MTTTGTDKARLSVCECEIEHLHEVLSGLSASVKSIESQLTGLTARLDLIVKHAPKVAMVVGAVWLALNRVDAAVITAVLKALQ